jgi:hypothetical protein
MSLRMEPSYDPTTFVARISNLSNVVFLLRDQIAREEDLDIPDTYLELPLTGLLTQCSWLHQAAVDGFWQPSLWSATAVPEIADPRALEECGSIFMDLNRHWSPVRYDYSLIVDTDTVPGKSVCDANFMFRLDLLSQGLGEVLDRLEANLTRLLSPKSAVSIIMGWHNPGDVQPSLLQRRTAGYALEGNSSQRRMSQSLVPPAAGDNSPQPERVHSFGINEYVYISLLFHQSLECGRCIA